MRGEGRASVLVQPHVLCLVQHSAVEDLVVDIQQAGREDDIDAVGGVHGQRDGERAVRLVHVVRRRDRLVVELVGRSVASLRCSAGKVVGDDQPNIWWVGQLRDEPEDEDVQPRVCLSSDSVAAVVSRTPSVDMRGVEHNRRGARALDDQSRRATTVRSVDEDAVRPAHSDVPAQ